MWTTNSAKMSQVSCSDKHAATAPGREMGSAGDGANEKESETVGEELQKPGASYIEMIGRAILDSPTKKLCLQDIYESIERAHPYFRSAHPGWRNSVRHNLSLHECFYKGERCENGKGHYWYVHPMNLDDFRRGDFRRRLVKARVRRMQSYCHPYAPEFYCSYAPLQYYVATTSTTPAAAVPLSRAYYPAVSSGPLPTASTRGFPFPTVAANLPLCISTQPLNNGSSRSPGGEHVGGYQQVINTAGARLNGLGSSQAVATSAPSTQTAFASPPGFLFTVKNILSTQ